MRDCIEIRLDAKITSRTQSVAILVLGLFEIVIILGVALIVLGPERLPEVLKVTGKVLRELRAASNTVVRELTDAIEEPPPPPRRVDRPSDASGKPPEQS